MNSKILFIHHDSRIVGSTISLKNLIASLDRKKINPHVLLGSKGPSCEYFEELGIPVDVVKIRTFGTCPGLHWYKLGYYYNFLALLPNKYLRIYLKEIKPDIVHINDKALLSAGLTAKKVGIPIVWHIRSSYFSAYSKLQAEISRKIIRSCADQLIVISEDEMDGFEDLQKTKIIHNSVDIAQGLEAQKRREEIRSEFGVAEDEIAVATITSTINKVRGTWDFINAAGIVHRKLPQHRIKFFIVARIPPKINQKTWKEKFLGRDYLHPLDQANKLIRKNGLEEVMSLTGFRDDPLVVMSGMDIVVVCNRHGVLGRIPFEAMSVGTPVVATAGHSGKSRVAVNGETAVIAEARNPRAIADGIIRIIKDEELRQKLIINGKANATNFFDPPKNARLVEQVYAELIGQRKL